MSFARASVLGRRFAAAASSADMLYVLLHWLPSVASTCLLSGFASTQPYYLALFFLARTKNVGSPLLPSQNPTKNLVTTDVPACCCRCCCNRDLRFQAMARDMKINYNQLTVGQVRRMCDTLLSLAVDERVVAIPERVLSEISPGGERGNAVQEQASSRFFFCVSFSQSCEVTFYLTEGVLRKQEKILCFHVRRANCSRGLYMRARLAYFGTWWASKAHVESPFPSISTSKARVESPRPFSVSTFYDFFLLPSTCTKSGIFGGQRRHHTTATDVFSKRKIGGIARGVAKDLVKNPTDGVSRSC